MKQMQFRYVREQHLVKTHTHPVKYVSAEGHEIKERGPSICHYYKPHLQMRLSQHSNKKVKSLTIQVKFLICYSLLSFVFPKQGKHCPVFVLLVIIKHAVVAFISSKREGIPCEIVNHRLAVP